MKKMLMVMTIISVLAISFAVSTLETNNEASGEIDVASMVRGA
ncbi:MULTISPECIES: lysogeny pheromone AimP family peptide [Bacillus]|nr:lysogeny pheromone AimP family peptide [Bacillus amyloliquefaciens]